MEMERVIDIRAGTGATECEVYLTLLYKIPYIYDLLGMGLKNLSTLSFHP